MMKKLSFFAFWLFSILAFGQHDHSQNLDNSIGRFIENKGQWKENITFKSTLPNAEVYATPNGISYFLKDNKTYSQYMQQLHDGMYNPDSSYLYDACIVSVNFKNANSNLRTTGKNPYSERRNYLIGNDSTAWAKNVLSYTTINTKNVYDGIDFEMKHAQDAVKYEFQVDARIDYRDIKLEITGHQGLEVNSYGELVIKNNIKDIIESKPVAYQIIKGKYRPIPCQFIINKDSTVSYRLGKGYSNRYPVVIDPQLIFSTASGSTADNWGNTACLDNNGNLYSGGTVFRGDGHYYLENGSWVQDQDPTGFPATTGAFQSSFQGGTTDIGILKFDSSGQNLIYATYIGGNNSDVPTSIVANEKQELFILSVTGSNNFPSAVNSFSGGGYVSINGYAFTTGTDICVMKLDSTGSNLIRSRYVGGPGNDGNNIGNNYYSNLPVSNYGDQLRGEIILDSTENIYIASSTNNYGLLDVDPQFPTKNGFGPTFNGGYQDGVIFKVHSSMDSLIWSSYIGSPGNDAAMSLKLSTDNSILVTGATGGRAFDLNPKAYIPDTIGGIDGFVAKISPEGDQVTAYTYLGTPEKDVSYFVELDQDDNVYLLGQTHGDYGYFPEDIYKIENEGVFIHKLSPELDASFFYTTIGDTLDNIIQPDLSPTAFLVNECGNIFISGWGGKTNYTSYSFPNDNDLFNGYTNHLPITSNAFQPTTDGSDFYMAVYLKNMDSLLYATYYGVDGVGEHVDGGTSRFSDRGIVYQSVCAGCGGNDFVVFPENSTGEYPKQNSSGNCNNGVFKYDLSSLSAVIETDTTCGPLKTQFLNKTVGGVDFHWFFGDGTDTLVVSKDPIYHEYKTPGEYKVRMVTTDLTTCKRKDTSTVIITVSDRLENKSFDDTLCLGEIKTWNQHSSTDFDYLWSPTNYLQNPNSKDPTLTGTTTTKYIVELTDSLNCKRHDTVNIFVPQFTPNLDLSVLSNCKHESMPKIQMNANYESNFTPESLLWHINDFKVTTFDDNFTYDPSSFGKHEVHVEVSSKNCHFHDSSSVILPQIKIPNIITPNGDNKNDSFVIEGLDAGGKWEMTILNRWGKQIFFSEEYKNNWGATLEAPGTYFYEIVAPDKSKCKGWIQVVK